MLAGIGAGIFRGLEEAASMVELSARFEPRMGAADRAAHLSRWSDAIERAHSTGSRK
jgi:glycerol kinase